MMDRADYEKRVPDLDPSGVMSHLLEEIFRSLRAADSAERLLIGLIHGAVEKGVTVDSIAYELKISKNDAQTLVSGASMMKDRISRS